MKAITIKQPYATLITLGIIDVYRSYFKVPQYDTYFIYASTAPDASFIKNPIAFIQKINLLYGTELDTFSDLAEIFEFPLGGIVGVADLISCEPIYSNILRAEAFSLCFANQVIYPFKKCGGIGQVFDVCFSPSDKIDYDNYPLFNVKNATLCWSL